VTRYVIFDIDSSSDTFIHDVMTTDDESEVEQATRELWNSTGHANAWYTDYEAAQVDWPELMEEYESSN